MNKTSPHGWPIGEISLSVVVLFILLSFTYAAFVHAPYTGFYMNPQDGRIVAIYLQDAGEQPFLQLDDLILRVGDASFDEYSSDGRKNLYEGFQAGQVVDILVDRDGTQLTIPWKLPGFNPAEFNRRFFNLWWLAFVYWLFGSATQLFIRPRNEALRNLLIAANYLTGLWVIFGCLSGWHLWESSILLHAVTWLILPVYLHLNWIFPHPLRALPKWVLFILYGAGLSLAVAELVPLLPRRAYAMGFLAAVSGSAVLQAVHFIRRPEQRREVGFIGTAILLVLIPLIALLISGAYSTLSTITFFALPALPLAYFYLIYRRQVGGVEVRANRLLSAYAYLILLSTLLMLLLRPAGLLYMSHEGTVFLLLVVASLAAFISILVFPSFQAFVEQRFLGIKLPYQNLQERYSARITASTSVPSLLLLLEEEVFPSLLVRQFAFIQVSGRNLSVLISHGVKAHQLPGKLDLESLMKAHMNVREDDAPAKESPLAAWLRLSLPLRVGDDLVGLWLFGRRDPDDFYHEQEIITLQSLANQTAIALSNIVHTEQLRRMYQVDVERFERERLRLALDLHDSVLNQLAVLRTNLDASQLSPRVEQAYEETTRRLREIVSDLRPPMLLYGLKPAIEELADNLMERSEDRIRVIVDVESSEERVSPNIEEHLFRIMQEACENAVRHGHASNIRIAGSLSPRRIELTIEDDGAGFELGDQLELEQLLAANHFGLAGIVERVGIIGGQIHPQSRPGNGTKLHVLWAPGLHES
jgi:signal transduction histidine kinase